MRTLVRKKGRSSPGPGDWLRLALLASALGAAPTSGRAEGGPPAPSRIEVSFKLDERLTRGLYMGDRWVSPPTYTANLPAGSASVQARAHLVDARGRRTLAAARWIASGPAVSVTPAEGGEVRLSLSAAGQSLLRVVAGDLSQQLTVKAVRNDLALRVEILQEATASAGTPSPRPPARAPATVVTKVTAGYAMGHAIGARLKQQGREVDVEALAQGVADALESRTTLLSHAEIAAVLAQLRTSSRPPRAGRTSAASP